MKPYTASQIVPRRIYLDTSTFQALADVGGYVFDDAPFPVIGDYALERAPQILKRADHQSILVSLRLIFRFNERAQFDWVVSSASLKEIDAAGDHWRSGYARDILEHTRACIVDDPPGKHAKLLAEGVNKKAFGSIADKDLALLRDAVALECDTFLTLEKRLPTQASVILKKLPLIVCTPMDLWETLKPHVRGL